MGARSGAHPRPHLEPSVLCLARTRHPVQRRPRHGLVEQRHRPARRRYGRLYGLARQTARARRAGLLADAWAGDHRAAPPCPRLHRPPARARGRHPCLSARRSRRDRRHRRAALCRPRSAPAARRRPLGRGPSDRPDRTQHRDPRRRALPPCPSAAARLKAGKSHPRRRVLQLTGVRVVDLTRILAGPFCTMLLADMGAEVVKIETPRSGDPVRRQGAIRDGLSWYFAAFNRNKRSLTLNLRHEEGRRVLARLIAQSDVLVENFRPGVLARMGFDEARLAALNPALVVCGISGFGTSGPYRERPSFDFIAHAMISLLGFLAADYFATGKAPRRTGNDHAIVAPYGLFRTRDGAIAVAPSQEESYQRLIDALAMPELRDDPRFLTNALRVANRAAINRAIAARLESETSDYWIAKLNAAGVP